MTTSDEPYRPTIRTQAELERVWRHLMQPLGFGRRSVWLLQVAADRRPTSMITEITECDERPDTEMCTGLAGILEQLDAAEPGGSFAFLVSRPGRGVDVVHLATDHDVVPLPLDEIGLAHPA